MWIHSPWNIFNLNVCMLIPITHVTGTCIICIYIYLACHKGTFRPLHDAYIVTPCCIIMLSYCLCSSFILTVLISGHTLSKDVMIELKKCHRFCGYCASLDVDCEYKTTVSFFLKYLYSVITSCRVTKKISFS